MCYENMKYVRIFLISVCMALLQNYVGYGGYFGIVKYAEVLSRKDSIKKTNYAKIFFLCNSESFHREFYSTIKMQGFPSSLLLYPYTMWSGYFEIMKIDNGN